MKYDLTVIIPVYNTEKYLRRCLDSIVHQEEIEKCSLRVLCINDGSTDNSENIIREYVEKYPFIELFSKENGGVSDARNYGLEQTKSSDYITFIDPDDSIYKNYLKEFMFAKGKDVIYFDIDLFDNAEKTIKHLKVNPFYDSTATTNNIRLFMLTKHASWTRIYKSSLIESYRFPKGKIYEDIALMPFVTSKCSDVSYIQKYLYKYTVNTSNSIMNSSKSNIFDIYDALEYLFSLFGDEFEMYREELQYLALEHLCVGHTYRLLKYPKATKQDFKDIILFMEKYFGKNWERNKYIKQGIQKVNINSALAYVVPLFLKILKYRCFSLLLVMKHKVS
ncbi:glycosyltransferase [Streptococcus cristatus]|uniref:Putative glycosyltransferase EpsH n=1 Tax=Streptococcus cristatus TaxID=45634 RepID=A0A428GLD4_STRCR|nr:glycosyltransferase [Streptococcus cristatus]MBZ2151106.1 glycosyltransferase [Streptococcus cristatus]RSJ79901.1 putative glycosyltransferase EpsH [Streptococcus cristatus]